MDLRAFEYFLTVARERNVSRAAELLQVSQPTVSRQIQELEVDLGRTLFVRAGRTMELTEEGKNFQKTAETMMQLYLQTKHASGEDSTPSGEIYLGVVECGAFRKVAELITRFQKQHPKVAFHIAVGDNLGIKEQLQNGWLDYALVIQDTPADSVQVLSQWEEKWYMAVPESHELASCSEVTLDQVRQHPLIVPENDRVLKHPQHFCGHFQITSTYTSLQSAFELSSAGAGQVILLSDGTYHQAGFTLLPIKEIYPIYAQLVRKDKKKESPASRSFFEYLQKEIS